MCPSGGQQRPKTDRQRLAIAIEIKDLGARPFPGHEADRAALQAEGVSDGREHGSCGGALDSTLSDRDRQDCRTGTRLAVSATNRRPRRCYCR